MLSPSGPAQSVMDCGVLPVNVYCTLSPTGKFGSVKLRPRISFSPSDQLLTLPRKSIVRLPPERNCMPALKLCEPVTYERANLSFVWPNSCSPGPVPAPYEKFRDESVTRRGV